MKKRKSLDRLKRQKCKLNDVTLVLIPSLFTRTKIDLSGAYSADTRARYNEMVVYAKSRGRRLLEKAYLGAQVMHEWECCEGHRWKAQAWSVVQTKTWCAVCAGVAKYSIDDLYSVARSRGGICLAKRYKVANHSVKWMCSKKHVWKNNFSNIKRGQWCRLCKEEADLFIE